MTRISNMWLRFCLVPLYRLGHKTLFWWFEFTDGELNWSIRMANSKASWERKTCCFMHKLYELIICITSNLNRIESQTSQLQEPLRDSLAWGWGKSIIKETKCACFFFSFSCKIRLSALWQNYYTIKSPVMLKSYFLFFRASDF